MIKSKAGFITKLQAILDNSNHHHLITWSVSGNSFIILRPTIFEQSILTSYFRHKKMSSFIRQLNMYGFHKCRSEKGVLQFMHPLFLKSSPEHHHLIERKKSADVAFDLSNLNKKTSVLSSKDMNMMEEELNISLKNIEEEEIPQLKSKFRLNDSQMTIRLTEKLTSLCHVEWEDLEDRPDENLSIICSEDHIRWNRQKNSQIETLLLSEGSAIFSEHL